MKEKKEKKERKAKKDKPLTPEEIMKYEVAAELGLKDKVDAVGWGGLTAAETGRIGGIMTRKKKAMARTQNMQNTNQANLQS